MDAKKNSLKTLIGLPLVLITATGIAFGAVKLHASLSPQESSTLTEGTIHTMALQNNLNSPTTNDHNDSDYEILLGEFSLALAAHDRDWNLRPGKPDITAAEVEPLAVAMIEAVCWMRVADPNGDQLPAGPVRTEFKNLLAQYQDEPSEISACTDLPAERAGLGQRAYELDDDHDGLNTPAETWYATDYYSADTDADGYSDLEEIMNGYSPRQAK